MFKNSKKSTLLLLCCWIAYVFSFSFIQATTDSNNQAKQPNITQEENKVCLTMIVKNESQIIGRCLMSVKDIVDYISICDTGSTDNTIEMIEKFMQENNIPGKVHKHAWQNFGYNRTLSAQAAQKTLEEFGFLYHAPIFFFSMQI